MSELENQVVSNMEQTESVNTENVNTQSTPVSVNWKDSLGELKDDPSIRDFKDITALARSYKDAQSMIGRSIRIPGEDASDEVKNEFYNKLKEVPGVARLPDLNDDKALNDFFNTLGRPETADKYQVSFPEGIDINQDALNNFKQIAHQAGLTNKQVAKLAEFEAARFQAYEQAEQQEQAQAQKILKDAWGSDYQNRLEGAKQVLNAYADKFPDAVDSLLNSGAKNNPAVVMMLSDLYNTFKESGALKVQQNISYGTSASEAKILVEEILNNSRHAYYNANDPAHDSAVSKVTELLRIANSNG